MEPELPLLVDPDEKTSRPLAPPTSEFAVEISTAPELVAVPSPLSSVSTPPVVALKKNHHHRPPKKNASVIFCLKVAHIFVVILPLRVIFLIALINI